MSEETESVKIRKLMMDSVRELVDKYPVLYDSAEEFVEAGVRNEIINARRMKR